jgi:hypothetical protein
MKELIHPIMRILNNNFSIDEIKTLWKELDKEGVYKSELEAYIESREIEDFFRSFGRHYLFQLFKDNGYDKWDTLMILTEKDFNIYPLNMVKLGDRKIILQNLSMVGMNFIDGNSWDGDGESRNNDEEEEEYDNQKESDE